MVVSRLTCFGLCQARPSCLACTNLYYDCAELKHRIPCIYSFRGTLDTCMYIRLDFTLIELPSGSASEHTGTAPHIVSRQALPEDGALAGDGGPDPEGNETIFSFL